MPAALRSSGIPYIDDVPWGSHLCLFYETPDDLIDTASRYFAPGLDGGELCVWAVPDHVSLAAAQDGLRDSVAGFDGHLAAGRLRLIGRDDWHGGDETADVAQIAAFWAGLIDVALQAINGVFAARHQIANGEVADPVGFDGALNRLLGHARHHQQIFLQLVQTLLKANTCHPNLPVM